MRMQKSDTKGKWKLFQKGLRDYSSLCKRQVLHILIINIKWTIGTLEKFSRSFRSKNRDNEINATFSKFYTCAKIAFKVQTTDKMARSSSIFIEMTILLPIVILSKLNDFGMHWKYKNIYMRFLPIRLQNTLNSTNKVISQLFTFVHIK